MKSGDVEFRRRRAAVRDIIGQKNRPRIDLIEAAVADMLRPPNDVLWPPRPQSKEEKKEARSIVAALRNLEIKLCGENLEEVVGRATWGAEDEFSKWKKQIAMWRECFEAFVGDVADDGSTLLPPAMSAWPPPLDHRKKSTDDLVYKRRAVETAAHLMKAHGLPLSTTRISSKSGGAGSKFCRVAAVLYGKNRADLSYQCREYKKRESRV